MTTVEPLRVSAASPAGALGVPEAPASLAPFREGRAEEHRLIDLLAFSLAVADGKAATPDTIPALRQRAEAELASHALRYLHNRVEEIRQEAVRERIGQLRQPPGLLKLVLANLLAMVLLLGASLWLSSRPDIVQHLRDNFGLSLAGTASPAALSQPGTRKPFSDIAAGTAGLTRG